MENLKKPKSNLRQWIEALVIVLPIVFLLRTFVFGLYHVPSGSAEPTILVGDYLFGNKFIYNFKDVQRGDHIVCDAPTFKFDKSNKINYLWQKYIGIPIPFLGLSAGPDNWTKRIIAIPGDTIEGKIEKGKTIIYLNGKKLDETAYVNPYPLIKAKRTTGLIDMNSFGPIAVPDFLRKVTVTNYYTFDPKISPEDQPFYKLNKENIIKNYNNEPIFRLPGTPTYGMSEAGVIRDPFGQVYQEESIDSFGPITLPEDKYWAMGDNRKNSADSRYWMFLDRDRIQGKVGFVIFSIDTNEASSLIELIKHPIDFWTKNIRWNRFLKAVPSNK